MNRFNDGVAVITGAASGIGRALAFELAGRGCKLAISDVNGDGLAEVASALQARNADLLSEVLDVSDRDAVYAHADAVMDRFGTVNLVINNAGVTVVDTVDELSYEDFEWVIDIDFWGVVYGSKAFLPHLKRAEWGHIVNVSSVFGIVAMPGQSSYNAAKFAVRGFTESLRQELELEGFDHVTATCVHPGGIATSIVDAARYGPGAQRLLGGNRDALRQEFRKIARTSPRDAARVILRGVEKRRRRVLIGLDAHFIDALQRVFPTTYQKLNVLFTRGRQRRHGLD